MDVAVMPPVVPERGGEITVTRRTGNYVFGEWRVTAPDGIEQIVPDKNINPGYLYRPPGAGSGRFDVAFVRMDASIELDHVSPNGATSGRSDVELQMDAGQKRSEGRVLVEREISARGIGRLQPGVHFTTGSLLKLRIWDFFIHLPLTAFDWRRDRHGAGWAFRCGGQLISDPETLRSLNSEAQSQIDAERRRAQEEAKRLEEQAEKDRQTAADIDKIAREGRTTANTANSTANRVNTLNSRVLDWTDSANNSMEAVKDLASAVRDIVFALRMLQVSGIVNAPMVWNSRINSAENSSNDANYLAWAGTKIDRRV